MAIWHNVSPQRRHEGSHGTKPPRKAPAIFNPGFAEDFTTKRIWFHEKSVTAEAFRVELPQGRAIKFRFNLSG
jgi:hypothetical protein